MPDPRLHRHAAEPRTVRAYLASLGESFAPNIIRRRLSAIGKAHRFNDLDWNAAHRDIQEPLRGALRKHGRPLSIASIRFPSRSIARYR